MNIHIANMIQCFKSTFHLTLLIMVSTVPVYISISIKEAHVATLLIIIFFVQTFLWAFIVTSAILVYVQALHRIRRAMQEHSLNVRTPSLTVDNPGNPVRLSLPPSYQEAVRARQESIEDEIRLPDLEELQSTAV